MAKVADSSGGPTWRIREEARNKVQTRVKSWIPKADYREFKAACALLGRPYGSVLRELIKAFLEDMEGFKANVMKGDGKS